MSGRRCATWWLLAALGGCAHLPAPAEPGERDTPGSLSTDQLLSIASAAEQMGDGLRAQQYLRAASHAGASPERTLPWLLRLYVADGQYRLAIDAARDHLRSHPEQIELRLLLAGLYEVTQLDAAAVEQYERVLAQKPDESRAHYALAALLREHDREPGRVDAHFRAYLALEPDGPGSAEARTALLKELP